MIDCAAPGSRVPSDWSDAMSRVSTASAAGMAASVVVVVGADVVVDVAGGCVALVRWPRLDAGLEGNAARRAAPY